jgi:hypothetical protein
VLRQSWAYSIATDSSAHILGTAYFDIRIRVPPMTWDSDIINLHMVAPPMRESRTGAYMHRITTEVLKALDTDWKSKILGATSDGTANMSGCVSGWQKRMEESCVHESFFRVHCGAHLLNLANGRGMAAMD